MITICQWFLTVYPVLVFPGPALRAASRPQGQITHDRTSNKIIWPILALSRERMHNSLLLGEAIVAVMLQWDVSSPWPHISNTQLYWNHSPFVYAHTNLASMAWSQPLSYLGFSTSDGSWRIALHDSFHSSRAFFFCMWQPHIPPKRKQTWLFIAVAYVPSAVPGWLSAQQSTS